MNKYLGITAEEYNLAFNYDRDKGKVYSVKSGNEIGSYTASGLVVTKRWGNRTLSISLGKLCYFLIHDCKLDRTDKIRYLDGDNTNLRPQNLQLAKYIAPDKVETTQNVKPIDENIVYHNESGLFIVRRGPKQAIYRCFTLKEAISIRNEWKLDNSIHKWDFTAKEIMKGSILA